MGKRAGGLVAVGVAVMALAAPAHAQQGACAGKLDADPRPGPLVRFGITPGVQTGQLGTGPVPPRTPEDPAKQLAALAQLRPANGPFVLRLHRFFWSDGKAGIEHFLALAKRYTAHGYLVELQLRYHPSAEQEGDIAAWVKHVREVVDRFGPNPRVVAIQVTNEVNLAFSPDSSDGGYDGAREALVQGVKAAKDEARKRGFTQLEIGFNWAYRNDPSKEQSFWTYLRDHGGPSFVRALDWVGVDAYPGTFIPPANSPGGERSSLVNVFSTFRCYAAIPKIPAHVPIHVEENGWPTGPGRSYERQAEAMQTMVQAVHDFRGTFNISDYRWFNLRDGDSTSANFQTQYGIMTDEYVPKPAFGLYRRLVAKFTTRIAQPPAGRTPVRLVLRVRCRRHAWRARIGGPDVKRVRRVTFRVGDRHARPDAKRPFVRSISARRLHHGRTSWTMVARVRLRHGGRVRLERTIHRCG
ncbi:MAG: hypothetical protein QOH38_1474 [Thermoleophilaceae bacterium]|nr:hypothetical protein [Thermoleophilaceae bacterium]